MKQPLLVTCLLLLSTVYTYAQDSKSPFRRSTYIKVNPTTLINELDISIEQELSEKLSLELGISGIYTDYPDYILSKKIDIGQKKPDISTEQFVDGRGLGFRAGLRWYLFSARDGLYRAMGTYFEPVLIYKKVFYPNEDVNINDNSIGTSQQTNLNADIDNDDVVRVAPETGVNMDTNHNGNRVAWQTDVNTNTNDNDDGIRHSERYQNQYGEDGSSSQTSLNIEV